MHPMHSTIETHTLPEAAALLATQSDLAAKWKISRARVSQLASSDQGFPEALRDIGGRPVYDVRQANAWWQKRQERLSGTS